MYSTLFTYTGKNWGHTPFKTYRMCEKYDCLHLFGIVGRIDLFLRLLNNEGRGLQEGNLANSAIFAHAGILVVRPLVADFLDAGQLARHSVHTGLQLTFGVAAVVL